MFLVQTAKSNLVMTLVGFMNNKLECKLTSPHPSPFRGGLGWGKLRKL